VRSLIATALLALIAGDAGEGAPAPESAIRVETGRARVATDAETLSLLAGARELRVAGPLHCELGIGSRTTVRWGGLGSATVDGKASFGVRTRAEEPEKPSLAFHFFRTAELELRRGSLAVALPNGWSLDLERGALSLRELVDGRIEVTNRGGKTLLLVGPAKRGTRGGAETRSLLRLSSGRTFLLPAG